MITPTMVPLLQSLPASPTAQPGGPLMLWQSPLALAAGALVLGGLAILLMVAFKAFRASRTTVAPGVVDGLGPAIESGTSSPSLSNANTPPALAEARRLLELMNQAEEQATRLEAQIAHREDRLRHLIQLADARLSNASRPEPDPPRVIVTPQAAAFQAERRAQSAQPLAAQFTEPAPVAPAAPSASTPARVHAPAAFSAAPASSPVATIPRSSPATMTDASGSSGGLDPLTAEVYRLADHGATPQEIAARLDQHPGKVELILALRSG